MQAITFSYMSPAMVMNDQRREDDIPEIQYHKGVKHLFENGHLQTVPRKYILPASDRPTTSIDVPNNVAKQNLQLPIIDFADLLGPNRPQALQSLANACEQYGFFQVGNWVDELNFRILIYSQITITFFSQTYHITY